MKKSYLFFAIAFFIFFSSCFSFIVSADEKHDKRDRSKYIHFQQYEEDDKEHHKDERKDKYDDDYDDDRYWNQNPFRSIGIKEVWYRWSKSANIPTELEPFPLTETSILALVVEQQTAQMEFIPQGSQVMVPIEEATKVMGGKVTVYPHSEIIEINKGIRQLIVRNNSRVVYENMKKVPMQEKVIQRNGKYYMPLSVLANGLGFGIDNQVENNQIRLERMA